MFFVLSKLLDVALSPLSWAIALVLFGVDVRGRGLPRWRRWSPVAGMLVLYAFSVEPVAQALTAACEGLAPRTYRPEHRYDAAIVLGGLVEGSQPSLAEPVSYNQNVERILAGYELLRRDLVGVAVLSGGNWGPTSAEPPEAEVLADQLAAWGIPRERLVVEPDSRNTRENALFAARIARERGLRSIVVITSAFHMRRAMECFRAAGLPVDALPVDTRHRGKPQGLRQWLPQADSLALASGMIHELAGLLVYRVAGYGRSR